jgi:hypothetical protein
VTSGYVVNMNVSDLLEALSQADPAGPVIIDVDSRQRPVDAVVMTDGQGTTVLMADPAGTLPFQPDSN